MAARGALCVFASLQGSFGTLLTDYQGRGGGNVVAFFTPNPLMRQKRFRNWVTCGAVEVERLFESSREARSEGGSGKDR